MIQSIEELRREHQQSRIGLQLAELILRVARSTAHRYPPAIYSDSGVWNSEAIEDAAQEWTEARLLRRHDLAAMLARASSMKALQGALTISFSQWLINQRPRTSITNLFKRAKDLLEQDSSFTAVGRATKAALQQWTVSGAPDSQPSELSLADLANISRQLTDDELHLVRYGPYSLKSSPILRQPGLQAFLTHLLGNAKGTLSLGQITETMRRRFGLYEFEARELDESLVSPAPDVLRSVEQRDLARRLLANLTPDGVFALKTISGQGGDIAKAALFSKSSEAELEDHLTFALSWLAKFCESPEEAAATYTVFESLLVEVGDV